MVDSTYQAPPRHRPPPLSTQGASDRSYLLSTLRTAPAQTHSPLSSMGPPSPAYSIQQVQAAYLVQLQQQLLMQQSQMNLLLANQQQQAEAEKALLAMRSRSSGLVSAAGATGADSRDNSNFVRAQMPPHSAGARTQFLSPEDEETVASNPLARSALARRKRQSMLELAPGAHDLARQQLQQQQQQQQDRVGRHHRRSSSSTTGSEASSAKSHLTDPPSFVVSKPGEGFPSTTTTAATTSAPSSEEDETDPASTHAHSTSSSSTDSHGSSSTSHSSSPAHSPVVYLAPSDPAGPLAQGPRRPSQAGTLAAALSGRRQRPASIGIGIGIGIDRPNNGPASASASLGTRAVSDSSVPLSPFATTFQPLPPSPIAPSPAAFAFAYAYAYDRQNNNNNNISAPSPSSNRMLSAPPSSATTLGTTSVAVRQPRGPAPEAELGSLNFASRLRKRAVLLLSASRAGSVGRLSFGGLSAGANE